MGTRRMNVPVVTFEIPPEHSPSCPGMPSPHTLTCDGTSLNRTPPGRQIVAVSPTATVVVVGSTVQTGASPSIGPDGAEAGQWPAIGAGWSSNVGQDGAVGCCTIGGIDCGSGGPGMQEDTCSAPQTPFCPVGQLALQLCPHAPQLDGSDPKETQTLLQLVWPSPHATHAPSSQTLPSPHAFPQAPQLAGSLCVSRHWPSQN